MPRRAWVPEDLRDRPFRVDDALRAGLTRRRLQSSVWRSVFRGVHVHVDVDLTDEVLVEALRLAVPPGAALAGLTAAWWHGLWRPPPGRSVPLVTTSIQTSAHLSVTGARTRRQVLSVPDADVAEVRGVLVTSPERTTFDLVRDVPLVERVVVLDSVCAQGLEHWRLCEYVERHRRWPGVDFARIALRLCDPRARSSGETRLRMVVVLGGLPEPLVNPSIVIWAAEGQQVRFPDLLVRGPRRMCVGEYDGSYHDDPRQVDGDVARENLFVLDAGVPVLRYRQRTLRAPQTALHEISRAIDLRPRCDLRPEDFAAPRSRRPW